MELKAAVLYGTNEPLKIEERTIPPPKHHEVVVDVQFSGLCHSDLHVWEGHYGSTSIERMGVKLPLVLGHEVAGTIAAVGDEVTSCRVGDKVVVYPWIGDGICKVCMGGSEQYCEAITPLGLCRDGGFAEELLVPHERYLAEADDLALEDLAPLACAGITAYSSVRKAKLEANDLVLILGVGGLGHIAIQIAKNQFKAKVIAVDKRQDSLDLAEQEGADFAVNATTQKISDEIKKITGGRRVDAVVDFVGTSETSLTAFKALRRGGTMVLTGLSGDQPRFSLPEIAVKGVSVSGNYVGSMKDLRDLVELSRRGYVKIKSTRMKLVEINEAMRLMKEGRVLGRIIMIP